MFKPLAVAMSATCLAFAASANPASPDSVSGLLQGMDSTDVVIEWIDDSTARVDATRNGYNFTVRLMDCDESKKCKSSLTFAAFDMGGTPDIAHSLLAIRIRKDTWLALTTRYHWPTKTTMANRK
mgnify:CR=1 FL=1